MNPKSVLRLAVAGVLCALIAIRLEAAEMALQVLHEFFPGTGPSYPFSPLLEEADGSFLSIK